MSREDEEGGRDERPALDEDEPRPDDLCFLDLLEPAATLALAVRKPETMCTDEADRFG